jgi:hypothetical protein
MKKRAKQGELMLKGASTGNELTAQVRYPRAVNF